MDIFFRIAVWNANGLVSHRQELLTFINHNKIDVLLISETHFTDRSYFSIPNYAVYCSNHPDNTAHGGSAVIIKNTIKHYVLPEIQMDYLQAASIVVEDSSGPLTLSAVYFPPRFNVTEQNFEQFFNGLGNKFLSGGDYNAKHQEWGSRLATPRGRTLLSVINRNNLNFSSTGEPTYWPSDINKTPDLLDFFVSKGISPNYVNVESCLDLSSDHSPIIMTYSLSVMQKVNLPFICNNKTDWIRFRTMLNSIISLKIPLKNTLDLEAAVNYFNTSVQKAAWDATPNAYNTTIKRENYPVFVKKKIAEKRRLRRIWQNSRNALDKNRLNRATRELKSMLTELRNEWFCEFTQGLSATKATEYSLWKATKHLKRPKQHIPPIRNNDGSWARNNEEKATAFSSYFCNVFKPFPSQRHLDESYIHDYLETPLQMSLPIPAFKPSEVKYTIDLEINKKKAPGYDLITGKVLQELPRKGIMLITLIFNALLRLEYFPQQWKVAQLVMVHKPGKPPNEVSSYRPISLLPVASKLFEKLLLKRLHPLISSNNLIPDHQFGFRRSHSTIQQVHRVVSKIREVLENKAICSAAFIDVRQAFDKVWHPGLLFKLKQSLPHSYYNILKSYLSDRQFMLKLEDVQSDLFPIESGVPQGSVLGPLLYIIFTADVPTTFNTTMATFADDTAILSSSDDPITASLNLQHNLNEFQNWLNRWRIKVSEAKSQHITFTLRKQNSPPVTLNNVVLTQVDSVKYLGVHIDKKLTWKTHIWNKRLQLNFKTSKLNWLLKKDSKLSLENKILLYKVILKPIWTYGIQLWGSASVSNIEIIQRYQSKLLRKIAGAPWYVSNQVLHQDLNIPTVKMEISKLSSRYQHKLENHDNNLALNLLDNSVSVYRLKRANILDLHDRF